MAHRRAIGPPKHPLPTQSVPTTPPNRTHTAQGGVPPAFPTNRRQGRLYTTNTIFHTKR